MARISGNGRDNVLTGTQGGDRILGNRGRDSLYGEGGADRLYGGEDADTLYGGVGDDFLDGGSSAYDVMYGGAGNDVFRQFSDGLLGDYGDYLYGGDGVDVVDNRWMPSAFAGNSTAIVFDSVERFILTDHSDWLRLGTNFEGMAIYGGRGDDTITTFTSENRIYGGSGSDTLSGAPFNGFGTLEDTLFGGGGDDLLTGWSGDDRLFGGPGRDSLEGGLGTDVIKGGGGADTIRLSGGNQFGERMEKFYGGKGADTFLVQDVFQNTTGRLLSIYDWEARDRMEFNDRTVGDASVLPHSFEELIERSEDTRRGVEIEYSADRFIILRGIEIDDLVEDSFSFFFVG